MWLKLHEILNEVYHYVGMVVFWFFIVVGGLFSALLIGFRIARFMHKVKLYINKKSD